MVDSIRKEGARTEQPEEQVPWEKLEQVDGRSPAMVVAMIRNLNFFRLDKNKEEEIDTKKFLDYIESHLDIELRLAIDPKVPFTRNSYSGPGVLISTFQEAGYSVTKPTIVLNEANLKAYIKIIKDSLSDAVKQVMKDYKKLSFGFRESIEEENPPLKV